LLAVEGRVVRHACPQAGGDDGLPPPLEAKEDDDLLVHARCPEDGLRLDARGPTEEVHDEGQCIDAEVEEGSTALSRVEVAVCPVVREAEARCHQAKLADLPAPDEPLELSHERDEPHPHALHAEELRPARNLDHPARVGGVHREGLLAQDRLAVLEREDRVLGVRRVLGRDVDDVHVRIARERLVARVRVRGAERAGERRSAVGRARGHSVELRRVFGRRSETRDELSRRSPRTEHPPANLPHAERAPSDIDIGVRAYDTSRACDVSRAS
jgi:hypothetical protein